jgi:hypothetical protein
MIDGKWNLSRGNDQPPDRIDFTLMLLIIPVVVAAMTGTISLTPDEKVTQ